MEIDWAEVLLVGVDRDYYAARPYEIRMQTYFVSQCGACGALVPDGGTSQHEEYHRINDIEVSVD